MKEAQTSALFHQSVWHVQPYRSSAPEPASVQDRACRRPGSRARGQALSSARRKVLKTSAKLSFTSKGGS